MKRRIERAIEQRTTMLNGVSHDLRTVLTRFKLSLALMGDGEDARSCKRTSPKCSACWRPISPSRAAPPARTPTKIDMSEFLEELRFDAVREGFDVKIAYSRRSERHVAAGRLQALPRQSHRQCAGPRQACRGRGVRDKRFLIVHVDDDGPGIPAGIARRRVPAVLPHRRSAQSGYRRHRAWPRDRARHRAIPRRQHHAWRQFYGRSAGYRARAGFRRDYPFLPNDGFIWLLN